MLSTRQRNAIVALAWLATACGAGRRTALDHLHPCRIDEGPTDAFCGSLRVFEDRARQSGRTIDLKIVVAPGLRRDARTDPLFVFEGGPGGGAATLARARVPMFRRFQTDRDIVFVDQRGTGGSNALDCSRFLPDEADIELLDEYPVERFRACLDGLTGDPRYYTTSHAMDDIDEVRAFLGYTQINLWGGSYGTRAALVYLKRHESAVRSVVLDGVVPTDMRLPLFAARDSQRSLDRLLADCAADASCRRQFPELQQTIGRLWARLEGRPTIQLTHPRTGELRTVTLSPRVIAGVVFQALYAPEVSALLPRLLTDAADGRFEGLFALAYARTRVEGDMSHGLFLSVVCAEDMPQIRPDDIAREAADRFIGTTMFDTQMQPCAFWPRGEVGADFHEAVTSNRPVLILSGAEDPVTPPSWGDQVAATLPRSKHLVVPGAGHITLMRGCVPRLVASFLDAASVDAVDPSCLQALARPPFFLRYTGSQRP